MTVAAFGSSLWSKNGIVHPRVEPSVDDISWYTDWSQAMDKVLDGTWLSSDEGG